jgi:hypothetical protein
MIFNNDLVGGNLKVVKLNENSIQESTNIEDNVDINDSNNKKTSVNDNFLIEGFF